MKIKTIKPYKETGVKVFPLRNMQQGLRTAIVFR